MSVGQGRTGEDRGGATTEKMLPEIGCHIERGGAQGNNFPLLAAAFNPLHMIRFGEGDESVDGIAIAEDAASMILEFVLCAFVVDLLDDGTEALGDFLEGTGNDVITKVRIVNPLDRLFAKKSVVQIGEELTIGGDGIFHCSVVPMLTVFAQQAAVFARVVETFEGAVDGEGADMHSEVIGGDGGHTVGLVEHDEVVREQDAAGFGGGWHPGIDQGEEQAVVDDNAVGRAQLLAGPLIETAAWVAVLPGASGTVCIDVIPDIGDRRWREFLNDTVFTFGRPFGEAGELVALVAGKEFGLLAALGFL